VSPLRLSNSLTKKEINNIYKQIKTILELAIIHNGTSISDFRRVDDKTGEFQNFLKVYGKKVCPICGNELIKIKQGGRTTSYCRKCQL
jgi:formamidopyrimidine-DNA glycosylase